MRTTTALIQKSNQKFDLNQKIGFLYFYCGLSTKLHRHPYDEFFNSTMKS